MERALLATGVGLRDTVEVRDVMDATEGVCATGWGDLSRDAGLSGS